MRGLACPIIYTHCCPLTYDGAAKAPPRDEGVLVHGRALRIKGSPHASFAYVLSFFYSHMPPFNRFRQERWDSGGFSIARKGATALCVAQLLTVGFGLLDFFPSASEPFVAYVPSGKDKFGVKPNKTKVDQLRSAINNCASSGQ